MVGALLKLQPPLYSTRYSMTHQWFQSQFIPSTNFPSHLSLILVCRPVTGPHIREGPVNFQK